MSQCFDIGSETAADMVISIVGFSLVNLMFCFSCKRNFVAGLKLFILLSIKVYKAIYVS